MNSPLPRLAQSRSGTSLWRRANRPFTTPLRRPSPTLSARNKGRIALLMAAAAGRGARRVGGGGGGDAAATLALPPSPSLCAPPSLPSSFAPPSRARRSGLLPLAPADPCQTA